MIAVLCTKREYFHQWLDSWICPDDKYKFRSVIRVDDVHGLRFTEVIRIGDWYNMKELTDVMDWIRCEKTN